jgi:hypothetical protein
MEEAPQMLLLVGSSLDLSAGYVTLAGELVTLSEKYYTLAGESVTLASSFAAFSGPHLAQPHAVPLVRRTRSA